MSGCDPIYVHRSVLPGRRGGGVGRGPRAASLQQILGVVARPGEGQLLFISPPPFLYHGRPHCGLLCGRGFCSLLSRVCFTVEQASPALSLLASLVNRGEYLLLPVHRERLRRHSVALRPSRAIVQPQCPWCHHRSFPGAGVT